MSTGDHELSGRILDATTSEGLSGVRVRAENGTFVAATMTATDGGYTLLLPDGDYDLSIEARPGDGLASLGYPGSSLPQMSLHLSENLLGIDLGIHPGNLLGCGKTTTAVGAEVSGAPLMALAADSSGALAESYSDARGRYCVALPMASGWNFALDDETAPGVSLIGTPGTESSPDLTVYPIDAWVAGTIRDEGGQPVAEVGVEVLHGVGARAMTKTTADGRYLLGFSTEPAGSWTLVVHGEALGFDPMAPVTVEAAQAQTVTRDFTLLRSFEPLFVDVDPVTTPTDQPTQSIGGNRSFNATVEVTVDPAVTVAPVTYPTATTWQCLLSNLAPGENTISVVATDGTSQYPALPVTIQYQPPVVNTIVITKAAYDSRKEVLTVNATSDYDNAQLQVDGYGAMTFSKLFKEKYVWTFSMGLAPKPATVTVSGPEGAVTAAIP
jgi:hypothetical protein